MLWSSGVSDENRNKAQELKCLGKGSRNNAPHVRIFQSALEHLGEGIVYQKSFQKYVVDVKQQSARSIMLTLSMHAGRLDIILTYVPQACHGDEHAAARVYNELESLLDVHYAFSPRVILGDFNARLIKALPNESGVVGPYTFGASWTELDCLSQAQQDTRSSFVVSCLSRNMEKLVTYRSVGVKKKAATVANTPRWISS